MPTPATARYDHKQDFTIGIRNYLHGSTPATFCVRDQSESKYRNDWLDASHYTELRSVLVALQIYFASIFPLAGIPGNTCP